MARLGGDAEEVRELPQRDTLAAAREQASGEPDGVEDGRRAAAAGEPLDRPIEEATRRSGRCARRAARRPRTRGSAGARARCAAPVAGRSCRIPVSAATSPGSAAPGSTSVSNVSTTSSARTRTAPISQMRELVRGQPRRLEVEDDELRVLERHVRVRIGRRARPRPAPGEARIALDHVVKQRAGEGGGGALEREQHAGGLVRRHRAVSRLDELDEPVGGVEGELHRFEPRRTYVRIQATRDGPEERGPPRRGTGPLGILGARAPSRP